MKNIVSNGVVHKIPVDLQKTLVSSLKTIEAWEDITPLARNEWLCWIESAKKPETRNIRIKRIKKDLLKGKRRPCCWSGCIHR
mgnify:CR=1 FL=1